MKIIFCLLLLLPLVLHAQDYPLRVKETYSKTDQNFDLDCTYSRNKTFKVITAVSQTVKSADKVTREFVVETESRKVPMTFTLSRTNKQINYSILFDRSHVSSNELDDREFFISPVADQSFNQEFETSKIYCSVNFATAAPVVLNDGNYHFNVHPHTIYDWQAKLKAPVELYLNNRHFESIILLEAGNGRGYLVNIHNFFNGLEANLPENNFPTDLVYVPYNVPLIVSPTGNNRFDIQAQNHLYITFTGGNHNYCMWNSTRNVLIGLMNSKSEARVTFTYDTKAIVAQQRGMEGLSINFSKQAIGQSNLLSDLLANQAIQTGYHASYLIFFRNLFAQEYSGMYRTFKINYAAPGYNETFIINGTGTKELEVNFDYI